MGFDGLQRFVCSLIPTVSRYEAHVDSVLTSAKSTFYSKTVIVQIETLQVQNMKVASFLFFSPQSRLFIILRFSSLQF